MFAYIKGNLSDKASNYVVVDVGGIGYKIFVSNKVIDTIGEIGSNVKVHTHYYVREDNISLYGFLTNEELRMFELLLSVSGIGAKSAIAMLSEISPSSFALAVITDDIMKLTKIPGIGNKTAARIVLELKDKLKTEQGITKEENVKNISEQNDNINEAVSALQVLGYAKYEISKAIDKIEGLDKLSIEDVIKKALQLLSK